jgi:peptidoglycan hydrolase-like protein with peptidoglycan-binding domain
METHPFNPTQADNPPPPSILHPWDVGPTVALLQELLQAHGFTLRVDGDFGWRTEALVKQFQRQHRLRIDGVVGPETWSALMGTVQPGKRLLRQGHIGADVNELQGLLQVNGFVIQRNGRFDAETHSAVISFQRQHHLRDDGVVDPVVWALLQGRRNSSRLSNNRKH